MIDIYVLSRLAVKTFYCKGYVWLRIILWQCSNQMAFLQAPNVFLPLVQHFWYYYSYLVTVSDVLFSA